MLSTTLARSVVAIAALAVLAAPAETMPTPVDVNGLTFDTTGLEKLRIKRLGRDQDQPTAAVTFDSATAWSAATNTVDVSGTYVTRGRRQNKVTFTLDNASLAAIRDDVIDPWGEEMLADAGRAPDGSVVMTGYKLKGKVNKAGDSIRIKGVFRFRATETSTGRTVGGTYTVNLRGGVR